MDRPIEMFHSFVDENHPLSLFLSEFHPYIPSPHLKVSSSQAIDSSQPWKIKVWTFQVRLRIQNSTSGYKLTSRSTLFNLTGFGALPYMQNFTLESNVSDSTILLILACLFVTSSKVACWGQAVNILISEWCFFFFLWVTQSRMLTKLVLDMKIERYQKILKFLNYSSFAFDFESGFHFANLGYSELLKYYSWLYSYLAVYFKDWHILR